MLALRRAMMVVAWVLLSVATLWTQARATVDAELLAGTEGLLGIPAVWQHGKPRHVVLNGARLLLSSGHSQESLAVLLDRATADCEKRSAGLHARAEQIAQYVKRPLPSLADGILRSQQADEGLVACFDLGEHEASWNELTERLQAFARDGDLEALGGIRLLRAQARSKGAFFVSLGSVGPAPLLRMFPAKGDAPGFDFQDVPRPEASRRVLSAWQERGAPALNIYESKQGKVDPLAEYVRRLGARGWLSPDPSSRAPSAAPALLLIKGGHQLVLSLQRQGESSLIVAMLLDAGPGAI